MANCEHPCYLSSDSEILRYYAPSRDDSKIPEVLKPISSLRKSTRTLEEVKSYRVVVMTLVTSGRLSLASLGQGHFTHVFVDEAGHATEPEALVAISGILGKQVKFSFKSTTIQPPKYLK